MYQNNNQSRVVTETDDFKYHTPSLQTQGPSKVVQFVLKCSGGRIKDEKQAEYVLLGLAVFGIIVSMFLFFGGGHKVKKPTPMQLEAIKSMPGIRKN